MQVFVIRFVKALKSAVACLFSLLYSHTAYIVAEPCFRFLGRRNKVSTIDLNKIERVLVIRLDEIGDVVMTSPLLRELRRNLPKAKISLLVNSVTYNLMEICPYVDEVLDIGPVSGRGIHVIKPPMRVIRVAAHHLWRRQFDLAIIPRWDDDVHQAVFAGYFSGALLRVGYSEKVNPRKLLHNMGRDRLLTHVLMENSVKHEVEYNLDIIKFLGGAVEQTLLELWDTERDKNFAETILTDAGVNHARPLVVLCPGAREKRRWPISGFIDLAIWLKSSYGAHVLVIGGPGDTPLGQELSSKAGDGVIDMTGRTTLRQTYALLRRSHLYVGGNTGPMHMAAAAGISVIEISCHPKSGLTASLTAPERVGPWTTHRAIIQPETAIPPCSDECTAKSPHCVTRITVDELKNAVEKVFSAETFALFGP